MAFLILLTVRPTLLLRMQISVSGALSKFPSFRLGLTSIDTYIIGHYNPPVRIIDLVSHTTYVVYVHFMHKWRDLHFKVDSEQQIYWETLQFYLLSEFLPKICWQEITEQILFVFCFDVWSGARTLAFRLQPLIAFGKTLIFQAKPMCDNYFLWVLLISIETIYELISKPHSHYNSETKQHIIQWDSQDKWTSVFQNTNS